jgi:hypothetical protein
MAHETVLIEHLAARAMSWIEVTLGILRVGGRSGQSQAVCKNVLSWQDDQRRRPP